MLFSLPFFKGRGSFLLWVLQPGPTMLSRAQGSAAVAVHPSHGESLSRADTRWHYSLCRLRAFPFC